MRLPPALTRFSRNFFRSAFPTIWEPGFLEQGRSTSDSRRRTSVATTLYSRRERSEGRENLCSLPLVSHPLLVSHALRSILFCFVCTSFSGHRPAQREWARTGLIGPMQGRCHPYPIQQPRKGWPHHRGLRPLLFSKSSLGSFTSHKNRSVKVL